VSARTGGSANVLASPQVPGLVMMRPTRGETWDSTSGYS
jgi:hypothetical protein